MIFKICAADAARMGQLFVDLSQLYQDLPVPSRQSSLSRLGMQSLMIGRRDAAASNTSNTTSGALSSLPLKTLIAGTVIYINAWMFVYNSSCKGVQESDVFGSLRHSLSESL